MRSRHGFFHNTVRFSGVLFKPLSQVFVGGLLHERTHRNVTQLGFGLTFKLWFAQFYRDDGGDSFADVFTEKVVVFFFQQAFVAGVLVDDRCKSSFETFDVHSAFSGGNTVGVSVDAFVISVVPLHGDIKLHAFVFIFIFERCNFCKQRLFRMVEVLHEVNNAALVLERDCLFASYSFVSKHHLKVLIKKGHGL